MERSLAAEALKEKEGEKVLLKGWVFEVRDMGNLKFLILRDVSGLIQITAHKEKTSKDVFETLSKLSKESVIAVEGKLKASKQAPGGKEVVPDKIEVMSISEQPLPIDIGDRSKTEMPKRLDFRSLDLHSRRTQSIFKIQSEIINSFRSFFKNKGFIEIQTPCIISAASEGGTELFPVMYFEKPAYLAQSPQLYKQMCMPLEKVFMTVPVWRAEKHNTPRHINEARQMDIEVAFADDMEVMKELEKVVQFIAKQINDGCSEELKQLGITLKIPKAKYLSYNEAIQLLKKNKVKISMGDDLPPEGERKLCELFPDAVILVHNWPSKLKPFYILPEKGFDAIYGNIEISSGGQRVHLPDLLIKQLKEKGLNPKHFEDYINSFRYGIPQHAGWSIGLERLTMAMLGLENIRESTLFPRDRDRLVP